MKFLFYIYKYSNETYVIINSERQVQQLIENIDSNLIFTEEELQILNPILEKYNLEKVNWVYKHNDINYNRIKFKTNKYDRLQLEELFLKEEIFEKDMQFNLYHLIFIMHEKYKRKITEFLTDEQIKDIINDFENDYQNKDLKNLDNWEFNANYNKFIDFKHQLRNYMNNDTIVLTYNFIPYNNILKYHIEIKLDSSQKIISSYYEYDRIKYNYSKNYLQKLENVV